jgi:hypothetical protein
MTQFVKVADHAYFGFTPVGRARRGAQKYRMHFVQIRRRDVILGRLLALYALWCALVRT